MSSRGPAKRSHSMISVASTIAVWNRIPRKHCSHRTVRRPKPPQPLQVRQAPRLAVAVDDPAPSEKLEHIVARLHELALERLAAPHHITHPVFGFARDAHHGEFA